MGFPKRGRLEDGEPVNVQVPGLEAAGERGPGVEEAHLLGNSVQPATV